MSYDNAYKSAVAVIYYFLYRVLKFYLTFVSQLIYFRFYSLLNKLSYRLSKYVCVPYARLSILRNYILSACDISDKILCLLLCSDYRSYLRFNVSLYQVD